MEAAVPSPTCLSGVRILVAEDDPDTRELLADYLRIYQAGVVAASTGNQAFALFEAERPHVLVSDLWMPDGDGFELIRRIRALPPQRGGLTPAVAVSAAENVRGALTAGYQLFVAKPCDVDALVEAACRLLGLAFSADEGAPSSGGP